MQDGYRDSRLYVTVRKRPEPERSLPQTVQVFRADDIKRRNIASPTDISAAVSGFSFNDPFGRFNPAPSMRGLTQPGLGDEPSVGFFNDGLYLSGRSSINTLAFDLDRIEAVKGPQSALYGRNSFGGAVNAISARPTRQAETAFDLRYATKRRFEGTAIASGPINDLLSARVALYARDHGGYFKNALPGGPDIGREKTQAGRVSLRYTPAPERDILLRLTHLRDDDSQPKGFLVPANCGRRIPDGTPRYYCGTLPKSGKPYAANAGHDGYWRNHTRAALEWTETLSHATTLALTLGGSTEQSEFIRDDDFSAQQAARAGQKIRRNDAQADARIIHTPESRAWDGLLGASFYRFFNHTERQDQYYVLGQTQPAGPVATGITHTAALYGSIGFALPAAFKLSFDGRYQREWKTLNSDIRDLNGDFLDLGDDWTAFTPKATLSWQKTPAGLLAYVSAAKGYKSGGFNDRANIFDSERVFGPERNWTYEAGVKNVALPAGLSLDLGAFYVDWRDQQVLAYSAAGATNNFFLNNTGQTTVKGVETALHWQWRDSTRLGLYYTYADARFDKYNDPDLRNIEGFAPDGDVSGNRLPRYSPHHLGIDLENRIPFGDTGWDVTSGAQFSFQSSQFTDNANLAKTGNRALLNLQAGFEQGHAYAGFFIDNALNERSPPVGISWSDARAGFSRAWLVTPQDGTTFGLRAKMKF